MEEHHPRSYLSYKTSQLAPQDAEPRPMPGFSHSHLFHDGILWVFALHNARLNEVPDAVIAAASSQDGEVGRLLGVLDPLLYTCKRLRKEKKMNRVWSWGVKRSFGQCLLGLCCSFLTSSSGGRLQAGNTALDTLNPTSARASQQTTHSSSGVATCNIPEGSKKHPMP